MPAMQIGNHLTLIHNPSSLQKESQSTTFQLRSLLRTAVTKVACENGALSYSMTNPSPSPPREQCANLTPYPRP